jgi:MinD-like ATPase involved in chromosome partitioning or flagellar assembly
MLLFHEVLPALLEKLSSNELLSDRWRALRILVARDPAGRVRLVFDEGGCGDDPLGAEPLEALEAELKRQLRGWFMGPLLATHSAPTSLARRLANQLVQLASEPWPVSWPDVTSDGQIVDVARLRTMQRFQGNQSWLIALSDQPGAQPPWPIEDGPKILAFYSFKGGVGRTTSLAIMAERFARAGKRVACIDLDLEAPGLADFLELSPIHGVVDALLSHAIHDELPAQLDDWWLTPALVPKLDDPTRLRVLAAGRLDAQYLDKLARLDLAMQDPQSVAAASLAALLEDTRTRHGLGPDDLIFIDCRAGLHELAGIALKRLSHLQILVARRSAQNLSGLRIAMAALAPRILDDERLLLLQTFVPIAPDARERELVAFRQSVLEIIQDEVIYKGQDVPQLEDEGVHKALSIPFYNTIIEVGSLQEVERSTKENETFDAIQEKLEELMR